MFWSQRLPSQRVVRDTGWPRFSWTVLAFAACVALGLLAYQWLLDARLAEQREAADKRLEFLTLTLDAVLTRHEVLPGVLALEGKLAAALDAPDESNRQAANEFLKAAAARAQVGAVYLIDERGITLSASNFDQPVSFVDRHYGFRPYFVDAMAGHLGRFYGVGVTTGEPGYFLARRIETARGTRGVVTVKVTLDGFEEAMRQSGEAVLLADREGIVFLSAVPAWKYRALGHVPRAVRERLQLHRQYGSAELLPLPGRDGVAPVTGRMTLVREQVEHEYSVVSHPMGPLGWQMLLLVEHHEAHRAAFTGALVVTLSATLLLAAGMQWDLRRRRRVDQRAAEARLRAAHAELEGKISERTTALSDANVRLERKIAELKQAEAIVRETQDKAVQAGKLAVLGQLSAGMSHELNQPLTALRTLADNGNKLLQQGRVGETQENLALISEVAARMGRTITQLKAFARKEAPSLRRVHVLHAVSQAAMLVEPRREELRATISCGEVSAELWVQADETRLAQVLVNLLRNGLDAVAPCTMRAIAVHAARAGSRVVLHVCDSGPGIAPDALPRLFEPFYTTKPAGQGLGLGLALSVQIVESLGGRLTAANGATGAVFTIELNAA